VFHDPDVFEYERDEWFARTWLCVGREADVARPGEYLLADVAGESVAVVRGRDGRLGAFHNVCRHRGSMLLTEPTGSIVRFQCPYHAWTYELDGRLLYARDMGAEFKPADHGLKPVACHDAGGMVFICLADNPPSIEGFLEKARRYLAPHRLADAKIAFESTIVEKGNWKLVIENNRECYHCAGAHPELCRTYPDRPGFTSMDENGAIEPAVTAHWEKCEAAGLPSKFVIDPAHQWRFARIPLLGPGESYTMDGKAAVPTKRLSSAPFAACGSLLNFHYPNTWNHFLADHSIVFRVLPIGPTETEVTTKWLVHKDAVEGVDYDIENLKRVWIATNDEDRQVVEENQRGINSPAYVPGPYSKIQEDGVIQFVDWYCRTLGDRLGRSAAMAAE
jgi:Rieske 2Fe-2S family protein